jgi:hypothetical protein
VAYIIKYITKVEPYLLLANPDEYTHMDSHILTRYMGFIEQIIIGLGLDIVRCMTSLIFLLIVLLSIRNLIVRLVY